MRNFNKFVNYKPCTDHIIITCKKGLWSVKGSYSLETALQAEAKYLQFKAAGKYKNIPKEKADARTEAIRFKSR